MESWKVGEVQIHRVVDLLMDMPTNFLFPQATPEQLLPLQSWLMPRRTRTTSLSMFIASKIDSVKGASCPPLFENAEELDRTATIAAG